MKYGAIGVFVKWSVQMLWTRQMLILKYNAMF